MEPVFRRQEKDTPGRIKLCGTLVFVGSLIVGFLLFVSVVLPVLENHGYEPSTCNVTESRLVTDKKHRLSCKCPHTGDITRCVIHYPCLQIIVKYENSLGIDNKALVVRTRRHVGDQCSLKLRDYDCLSETHVYKELKGLREHRGKVGESYTCHFKPERPDFVLLTCQRKMRLHIINVIVWPCLGLMVGLIVMKFNQPIARVCCEYRRPKYKSEEDWMPLTNDMGT